LKGDVLVKNVGIEDRQNIGQNCCRHIGQVSLGKKGCEKYIKPDKDEVTENRIPDAHNDKLDFCLVRTN